jgi:hypothetical protein
LSDLKDDDFFSLLKLLQAIIVAITIINITIAKMSIIFPVSMSYFSSENVVWSASSYYSFWKRR